MGVTQGWFQARFSEDRSENPALKLGFFVVFWFGRVGNLNFMHE